MKPNYKIEYIGKIYNSHKEMCIYNFKPLNLISCCSVTDRKGFVRSSLVGIWKIKKLK